MGMMSGADTRVRNVRCFEPSILRKEIKIIQCTNSNDKKITKSLDRLQITLWNFDFGKSEY